jgi:UDP-N-acetylglucosamine--dolichyl-phosphate N-acetylglucosaminephosphotransferase
MSIIIIALFLVTALLVILGQPVYQLITFSASLIFTDQLIKYCNTHKYLGKDKHKEGEPLVPLFGGIAVLFAIIIGMSFFIFFFQPPNTNEFLIATIAMTFVTLVGVLDDFSKQTNGLSQWLKPLLAGVGSITLLMTTLSPVRHIPFFGAVVLPYSLILLYVYIIFTGASNMVNMLAGFNGLEAGMGLVYTTLFALYAGQSGNMFIFYLSIIVLAALFGFFYFNKYPSLIFPGDALTYLLGAYIGIVATLGGMEREAFFVSIPFFIEFILKLRSRFQAQSFCNIEKGRLRHEGPIYSLTHVVAKLKLSEQHSVVLLILFELVCGSLMWVI